MIRDRTTRTFSKGLWLGVFVVLGISAYIVHRAANTFPVAAYFKVLRMTITDPQSVTFGGNADILLTDAPDTVLTVTRAKDDSTHFHWRLHGFFALKLDDRIIPKHILETGDVVVVDGQRYAYSWIEQRAKALATECNQARRVPLKDVVGGLPKGEEVKSFIELRDNSIHILDERTNILRGDSVISWQWEGTMAASEMDVRILRLGSGASFDSTSRKVCEYPNYTPLHGASNSVNYHLAVSRVSSDTLAWTVSWDRPPTGRYSMERKEGFYLFPTNAYHSQDAKYLSAFSGLFNMPYIRIEPDRGQWDIVWPIQHRIGRILSDPVECTIASIVHPNVSVVFRVGYVDSTGLLWWPWLLIASAFLIGVVLVASGCDSVGENEAMVRSGMPVLGALFLLFTARLIILTKLGLTFPFEDQLFLPNLLFMTMAPFVLLNLWSPWDGKGLFGYSSDVAVKPWRNVLLIVAGCLCIVPCLWFGRGFYSAGSSAMKFLVLLGILLALGPFLMLPRRIAAWCLCIILCIWLGSALYTAGSTTPKLLLLICFLLACSLLLMLPRLIRWLATKYRQIVEALTGCIERRGIWGSRSALDVLIATGDVLFVVLACTGLRSLFVIPMPLITAVGLIVVCVRFNDLRLESRPIRIYNRQIGSWHLGSVALFVMLGLVLTTCLAYGDDGLGVVLLMGILLAHRFTNLAERLDGKLLTKANLRGWLVWSVIILLVVPNVVWSYLESGELSSDRQSRRAAAVSHFDKVREHGMRYTEQDAEFFAVMGHYANHSTGRGIGLFSEVTEIHPTAVSVTSSVHVNDLSPLIGLFAPLGRTSLGLVFAAWALLLYGAFQGAFDKRHALAKAIAGLLIVSSGAYMVFGLFGWVPFTGRLIHGLGVDSVNEMLETVVLFGIAGAIHPNGVLMRLVAGRRT